MCAPEAREVDRLQLLKTSRGTQDETGREDARLSSAFCIFQLHLVLIDVHVCADREASQLFLSIAVGSPIVAQACLVFQQPRGGPPVPRRNAACDRHATGMRPKAKQASKLRKHRS